MLFAVRERDHLGITIASLRLKHPAPWTLHVDGAGDVRQVPVNRVVNLRAAELQVDAIILKYFAFSRILQILYKAVLGVAEA